MAERSGSDFYAILGKALAEPDFRARLRTQESRHQALADIDVKLTDAQLVELEHAMDAIDRLAQEFDIGPAAA